MMCSLCRPICILGFFCELHACISCCICTPIRFSMLTFWLIKDNDDDDDGSDKAMLTLYPRKKPRIRSTLVSTESQLNSAYVLFSVLFSSCRFVGTSKGSAHIHIHNSHRVLIIISIFWGHTRNTFCGTLYLPRSQVHNDRPVPIVTVILHIFSIAHARNSHAETLPVLNLTTSLCSSTPISYKMRKVGDSRTFKVNIRLLIICMAFRTSWPKWVFLGGGAKWGMVRC